MTSQSTRDEDLEDKLEIYRDELEVAEYFLFDPRAEYLTPALQGYRLSRSRYLRIKPAGGRLPSKELGLQLEADGSRLRFYDLASRRWLPTPQEARLAAIAALEQKEAALERSEAVRHQTEAVLEQKEVALEESEAVRRQKEAALEQKEAALEESEAVRRQAEVERLRQELAALRRRG